MPFQEKTGGVGRMAYKFGASSFFCLLFAMCERMEAKLRTFRVDRFNVRSCGV